MYLVRRGNPGWRNADADFWERIRASVERNYSPVAKLAARARHIRMNVIHHIHDIT